MRYKYPKTFHFPWSENLQNDDRLLPSLSGFEGQMVVATDKLDGENTTMYADYIHARSLDSRNHPSRNLIKGIHAEIQHDIPVRWRVCGENMYAKHSIYYDRLPSYFFVFSIWTDKNVCLDWGSTKEWCQLLGLHTVPELYVGIWNEDVIKSLFTGKSQFGDQQEGYVVRTWNAFHFSEFQQHVAKFVRKGHIQTSENWMTQAIVPNKLA